LIVNDGWSTLLVPVLIAVLAVALALAPAWWIRCTRGRTRAALLALLPAPMLMPPYLAFAGWSIARAPGGPLGDALERAGPAAMAAAGQIMAVVGLALWSWPLAAIILLCGLAGLGRDRLEALALDGAGPLRRAAAVMRHLWWSAALAVAVVALVHAGSAVPLHLAQFQTWALRIWAQLNLVSPAEVWWPTTPGAPLGAWVVLPLAALAGLAFAAVLARIRPAEAPVTPPTLAGLAGRVAVPALSIAAWAMAVVAPAWLFWSSVVDARSVLVFWRLAGASVADSAALAVLVGGLVALLSVIVGLLASSAGPLAGVVTRPLALLLVALSAALAVVPGVLIGSGVRALVDLFGEPGRALDDAGGTLLLAHLLRFAVLGAVVGWVVALSEPADLRDLRRLDAGRGLVGRLSGWWVSQRPTLLPAAGAALAAMALSIHEIEATVMVQPPGFRSLAARMLELLHYNRHEELAAAASSLALANVVLCLGCGLLLSPLLVRVWGLSAPDAPPATAKQ
jgi:2-aminoethylphosphonate transport system permease protein